MSERPYNVESHMEGGLRRVYSARRSLSHLDAAILTPDQFEQVQSILAAIDALERDLEGSLIEERRDTDEDKISPVRRQRVAD